MPRTRARVQAAVAVAAMNWLCLSPCAQAQSHPLEEAEVALAVDSGDIAPPAIERSVIYRQSVHIPNAAWIRLRFAQASLGVPPRGGQPTLLRITSAFDGGEQVLDAQSLREWSHTSAYFNGDTLTLEIIADPGAGFSHLAIEHAWVGIGVVVEPMTVCNPNDGRVLSGEPACGRLMPAGCTAFIIDDAAHCLLTAGHCSISGTSIVEFNVPLSNPNGSVNHPPPSDQYPVDGSSIQRVNLGVGNDWCYFGCFPNGTTLLTPYQSQASAYPLAPYAPTAFGQPLRVTGFGITTAPVPGSWNQAQKTAVGPYTFMSPSTIKHRVDSTGGNSGSPTVNLQNGQVIGIHTHGGCTATGGENIGTAIQQGGLQNALNNPLGVCRAFNPYGYCTPNYCACLVWYHTVFYTYHLLTAGPFAPGPPTFLTAVNVPPTLSVSFETNPVVAPGQSQVIITDFGSPPGEQSFDIQATTGAQTQITHVTITIISQPPLMPNLISPPDGAAGLTVLPMLSWSPSPDASSYLVQIADEPTFSKLEYAATTTQTSHAVAVALPANAPHFWRVIASNAAGDSPPSAFRMFSTSQTPVVLLVDDDNNAPDVRPYYTAALTAAGVPYVVYDVNNGGNPEPSPVQLAPFNAIIWFSGDAFGGTLNPRAGPDAASEVTLASWLNNGGCLFLSSQDYLFDRIGGGNTTPNFFMQQFLGVAAPVAHDVNQISVIGSGPFTDFGPFVFAFPVGFSNFTDMIDPEPGAAVAFNGEQGNIGVSRDAGIYRSSFWSFGFETIPDPLVRARLMGSMLSWFGELALGGPPACPADINHDSVVNVADLLSVISNWGFCTDCAKCLSDIYPDPHDCVVNVGDLLRVISSWGACP